MWSAKTEEKKCKTKAIPLNFWEEKIDHRREGNATFLIERELIPWRWWFLHLSRWSFITLKTSIVILKPHIHILWLLNFRLCFIIIIIDALLYPIFNPSSRKSSTPSSIIHICHIYCETNSCTEAFACLSHSCGLVWVISDYPNLFLSLLLYFNVNMVFFINLF